MGLPKGRTNNPKGRPRGSINKLGQELREMIHDFLEQNFKTIKRDFEKLEPKDRLKIYIDLLQYSLPKMQSVKTNIEFERMTDEELDRVISELKSVSNE